jgi:hypothetical protein
MVRFASILEVNGLGTFLIATPSFVRISVQALWKRDPSEMELLHPWAGKNALPDNTMGSDLQQPWLQVSANKADQYHPTKSAPA